jgi:hypothetical protein
MQLRAIERDIKLREDALRRCKYNLDCMKGHKEAVDYLAAEVFLLEDQLEQYKVVANLLREEQGSCDEMLPKA